ncbi:glycosyltransferase [Aeromonas caviae]|uniref:glycosyltransferase n=1 Tax=Aeromonas caviae TaxID=648 RepID=UPI003F742F7B
MVNTLYPPYNVGGAEKSVCLLANSVRYLNNEVYVISLDTKVKRTTVKRLSNVVNILFPNRNVFWRWDGEKHGKFKSLLWFLNDSFNVINFFNFVKILERVKPDIVHTNNLAGISVSLWLACKLKRIPIVHTLRDYYLLHPNCTLFDQSNGCTILNPEAAAKILSYSKYLLSSCVDSCVGISSHILERHKNSGFFINSLNEIIPNAIDGLCFNSGEIDKEKNKIVYFGRLERSKGIEKFIENAIPVLNKKKVLMHVFGRGEKQYVDSLKIKFLNSGINIHEHANLDQILNDALAVVVPSIWEEPFGRVVIEANSYGVPVFARNIGGLSELVVNGVNGMLYEDEFDCEFEQKLIGFIDWALSCDRYKISVNCDKYSSELIAKKYMDLYQKTIDMKR